MASRRHAAALLKHYGKKLLSYPNVVAVAIGRKSSNGEIDERGWCLRVHVTRKTKRRSARSVPRELTAPRGRPHLGSIELDVVQTGGTELHAEVRPGLGLYVSETGVIACLLQDEHGQRYVLTAGHVVGRSLVVDRARNGGLPFGDQPEAYLVAPFTGERAFIGPCVKCSAREPIDLGLVLVTARESDSIPQIAGVRDVGEGAEPLRAGEPVRVLRASGRFETSFHPGGDADGSVGFGYPRPGGGIETVVYHNMVFYPRSGRGGELSRGDSGSPVIDGENRLIGVHIGASTEQAEGDTLLVGYAIGCRAIARWVRGMFLLTPAGSVALE